MRFFFAKDPLLEFGFPFSVLVLKFFNMKPWTLLPRTLSLLVALASMGNAFATIIIEKGKSTVGTDLGCAPGNFPGQNGPPGAFTLNVFHDEADLTNRPAGNLSSQGWTTISWNISGTAINASASSTEGFNNSVCTPSVGGVGWVYGRGHGDFTITLTLDQTYTFTANLSGDVSGIPNGQGVLSAGTYTISGHTLGKMGGFSMTIALSPAPQPNICPDLVEATLPSIEVPVQIPNKPWQIGYGELNLSFVTAPSSDPNVSCQLTSNTGDLPVNIRPNILGEPFLQFATSSASATVSLYRAGTVGPLETVDFENGVNNGVLLNGPYDPNATYLRWSTSGFSTKVGPVSTPFGTGPLTYWVNLTAMGFSPDTLTMGAAVKKAEAYIHNKLIENLPFIAVYTIIQDPGNVAIQVIDQNGRTTGQSASGIVNQEIDSSVYYPSSMNPAIVLANKSDVAYKIIITGLANGPYGISVSTTHFPDGTTSAQGYSGQIAQGMSLAFQTIIGPGPDSKPQELTPDSGSSIDLLLTYLRALRLNDGPRRSLEAKLLNAQQAIFAPNHIQSQNAKGLIEAFENEVKSNRQLPISVDQRSLLVQWAGAIRGQID
jgi:hypothetical protein